MRVSACLRATNLLVFDGVVVARARLFQLHRERDPGTTRQSGENEDEPRDVHRPAAVDVSVVGQHGRYSSLVEKYLTSTKKNQDDSEHRV